MKLSAVILTKNEEQNIADCIDALSFCDEIIVVDDYSNDRTKEVIENQKNLKVIFVQHTLEKNFSAQRNFALDLAKGEWVLFIDADERVLDSTAVEIQKVIESSAYDGFYLTRKDILWGKQLQYGETGNIQLLRLAKKSVGKWTGKVHETWVVKGNIGILANPIIHLPHQNISEFLQEINVYSTLRAEELYEKKTKSNLFYIILYPKMKFIKNYFLLKGYKDGLAGFVHAMIMSMHSFLVRGKLYLLWKGIKNS